MAARRRRAHRGLGARHQRDLARRNPGRRLYAGWGERRSAAQEERLAGLVWIPLDTQIVDEWAELKANSLQNGWSLPDNDLWIAATASAKDLTLVSCDRGFQAVPGLDWIYLPAQPESKGVS